MQSREPGYIERDRIGSRGTITQNRGSSMRRVELKIMGFSALFCLTSFANQAIADPFTTGSANNNQKQAGSQPAQKLPREGKLSGTRTDFKSAK